jgi:hypothetical protein
VLNEIKPAAPLIIDDVTITSFGDRNDDLSLTIEKNNSAIFFARGRYDGETILNEIETNEKISVVAFECVYPSAMDELAERRGYATPSLLRAALHKLKRKDLKIYVYRLNPATVDLVKDELKSDPISANVFPLDDGDIIEF